MRGWVSIVQNFEPSPLTGWNWASYLIGGIKSSILKTSERRFHCCILVAGKLYCLAGNHYSCVLSIHTCGMFD